jgi:hypothetical protein
MRVPIVKTLLSREQPFGIEFYRYLAHELVRTEAMAILWSLIEQVVTTERERQE